MKLKLSDLSYGIKPVGNEEDFKIGEYYVEETWDPECVFIFKFEGETLNGGTTPATHIGALPVPLHVPADEYSRPIYKLNSRAYSQEQLDDFVEKTGHKLEQMIYTALIT